MSCKDCVNPSPYCRCQTKKKKEIDKIIEDFEKLDDILADAKPTKAFERVKNRIQKENQIHWNENESIE